MKSETRSVVVMAVLLVGSQLVALAAAGPYLSAGFQAFQNPGDVSNALVYIVAVLVFTAIILLLVRYRRQNLVRYIILASVLITVGFVLVLPYYYLLAVLPFFVIDANTAANVASLLAFGTGVLVTWILVKFPEWYVVDSVGLVTAAGVTAILGVSFSILPALLLLIALACYDAWAVYGTKHMVTLADEVTSQRLPVLLVIPKERGYKLAQQPRLKDALAKGEEREAMFIGLGDLIIPGMLSVSALVTLENAFPGLTSWGGLPASLLVALGTLLGSLAGFTVLMRFVLKGNPQAGLPLLNSGAIAGLFLFHALVYGTLLPPLL